MEPPTVLVTGASGLVGTWLRRTAPTDVRVVALVHRTAVAGTDAVVADLRDAEAVAAAVARVRPTTVIHAAMAVDAESIVTATAHVAREAERVGAGLVFVSTDAVFSGDGHLVAEGAAPDPIWDYGRWKAEAEEVVARSATDGAILRLSLVVSVDPDDGTVARVRQAAVDGAPTRWFHDELRQPAMASDIAAAIWRIAALAPTERRGPWHLVGAERLSRYEIAVRAAEALGVDPASIESEATPAGLTRPRALLLGSDRAAAAIGWRPAPILR